MNTSMRRYFQAGSLAVWGAVAVSFVVSGRAGSYLHPSFHVWTAFCGSVLLLLAAGILFFPDDEADCCHDDCGEAHGHHSLAGLIVSTAILVIPLLLGVAVSPGQFSAVAVMNRGVAESLVDLPGVTAPSPFVEPPLPTLDGSPGEPGLPMDTGGYLSRNEHGQLIVSTIDLLYAAQEPAMRREFDNQDIEVVGQFFPARRNNPSGDRFSLIRMYVLCCAADARPVAISVRTPNQESFPDMSWVKVAGRVTFPLEGGRPVPVIDATSVVPTDAPSESFIY